MTDIEKIAYAKSFIDKLANGINPIDDSTIADGDVVNNVRLSRCFFFVSDVLRQVIENGGITPAPVLKEKHPKKKAYSLTPEQIENFRYSEIPITSTHILDEIDAIGPKEGVRRLPRKKLVRWLISLGLLEEIMIDRQKVRRPTESGKEMGIILEERRGPHGSYYVVLYNIDAQHFIMDNVEAMLSFDNKIYKEKMNLNNQGKNWSEEENEALLSLFNEGLKISEIALMLKRSETGVRIRLRKNGIDIDSVI